MILIELSTRGKLMHETYNNSWMPHFYLLYWFQWLWLRDRRTGTKVYASRLYNGWFLATASRVGGWWSSVFNNPAQDDDQPDCTWYGSGALHTSSGSLRTCSWGITRKVSTDGLISALAIRCNYSRDIQLWFPLSKAIPTFQVDLSLKESSADFRNQSGLETCLNIEIADQKADI